MNIVWLYSFSSSYRVTSNKQNLYKFRKILQKSSKFEGFCRAQTSGMIIS